MPNQFTKREKILKAFISMCGKINRCPSIEEFRRETGFTRDMVRHYFGSMEYLYQEAKKENPILFKDSLSEILNPQSLSKLKSTINRNKRFFITTAVTGCEVDPDFMACITNYCKVNKSQLLTLIAADPAAKATVRGFLDPLIPRDSVVVTTVRLNSNLHVSTIKLSAKNIDPTTSLTRVGQRNGSFVYASPKQRLRMVPVSNTKISHAIMTTGAVTRSNYSTDRYMSERTAFIAENDHVLGGIIVEIVNDKMFHFRQVQFKDGAFIDIGNKYYPDKVEKVKAEAFILGDWHSGSTDPLAISAWKDICNKLQPKHLIIHDLFDGKSINHHEAHNIVSRAQTANSCGLNLRQELAATALDLDELTKWADEIDIVKSNHDEFLNRYLQEGRYIYDAINHGIALKIADAWVNDRKDPLKFAITELIGVKNPDKIKWLERDEDLKIAGIQCGSHGDAGANGARGSLQTMENAYGSSITGHSHTAQILRGAWACGTSTFLRLSYNRGSSSWTQTSCLVYEDGSRQLINCIEGLWKL